MDEQVQPRGLSAAEVEERVARGEVNVDAGVHTRSVRQIVRENTLTLFNAINVILAVFVLVTGSYKNMLFMVVIVCNTAIGIVQEIRSKRTTDRLSIVASSKATVLRDGARTELPLDQLVRDDVIELGRGDQIPADAEVVSGTCDVNESLLTGESKLVKKRPGDELMSGSFVNAGIVLARVVHVGAENYAAKISAEAKQHKAVNSEIMNSLNRIIRFVSFVIFPLGALLFARQHFLGGVETNGAILSTVSALVGMIPEGLILLTSTVLAVAVVRLAKSKVLVQQLYCIETLARVDTLCLDKTGTITTGKMEVEAVCPVKGVGQDAVDAAFASIARADDDPNDTALAIVEHYARSGVGSLRPVRTVPFSSDKKWSGATFANGESYVMGAGQFILGDAFVEVAEQQERLAADARVLLLARVEGFTEDGNLVTRDLLYDKATNKQFITVQTSGGNTFYIVIDYDKPTDEDGEQYQTYFLNMVDEADLLAAMQAAGGELPECSCADKCAVGAINTDCIVCAVNMGECQGKAPEPAPVVEPEPDPEPEQSKSSSGTLLLVLAVAVIGGVAGWYLKIYRPKKQQTADAAEDYGDDYDDTPPWEGEDETESEDEE